MPSVRTKQVKKPLQSVLGKQPVTLSGSRLAVAAALADAKSQGPVDLSTCDVVFPARDSRERLAYRLKDGKQVSTHRWAVYDYVMQVPAGKVTTYKAIANAIGGSPRSVGSALGNNPFAPKIPCHRVIATNLFVGGFFGEWGTNTTSESKTKSKEAGETTRCDDKLEMLAREGVEFNEKGILKGRQYLWDGVAVKSISL